MLSRLHIYDERDVWDQPTRTIFSEEEEAEGAAILKQLGVERGRYVCFHARDMRYSTLRHGAMFRERGIIDDFDRTTAYQRKRNMDFTTYFKTFAWLETQGLKAVRLGADAEGKFSHPNLIDFAAMRETFANPELADLYILANCKLYVGQATGITTCASALSVPGVGVNWFPYMQTSKPTPTFKVCRIKLVSYKGRTLDTVRSCHVWDGMDWNQFYMICEEIDVIDNSPQEILSSVQRAFDIHARIAA